MSAGRPVTADYSVREYDAGPTLDQHWFTVLCLLDTASTTWTTPCPGLSSIKSAPRHPSRGRRVYALRVTPATVLANTIHWANAGLMLGHRRRQWASISPALAQCIVLAGVCGGKNSWHCTLDHCWWSVGATSVFSWIFIGCSVPAYLLVPVHHNSHILQTCFRFV